MAEKSKEELIVELISSVASIYTDWDDRKGAEARIETKEKARAAVLARMCGPGEVVVPREPTQKMLDATSEARGRGAKAAYTAMLAARPNNGGNDDAGK